MRPLKVLPLHTLSKWYAQEPEIVEEEGVLTEIEPVFNRVGWYYDPNTGKCWFELSNGKAYDYTYQSGYFKWKLQYLEASYRRLRPKDVAAIEVLHRSKLLPKELKERWRWELHVLDLRNSYLEALINVKRWDKKNRVLNPEDYHE